MPKPIRVLQVFALMNRGGAETMIMNIYRNINRDKIQFDFIVHTEEKCVFDDEINSLGGRIYRLPRYTGKNHFQYIKAWNNFFKENNEYKIIHGHVRSTAAIYLRIAKKYGLSTIAHSHSTSSGSGLPAIAKSILQLPIRYIADNLFACSESAGEWLFGKRVNRRKNYFIIKNAIEIEKFLFNKKVRERKRRELGIQNKFIVGHIGRFNTPKNHDFIIDVFNEIYKRNNHALLMLVGEGEIKSQIEKKVNGIGISENVIFTGLREDIDELLQAMDVFLFPSLYEGLPVTLIEAQANGIRCIVSDTISREVKITDRVEFLSLQKSPRWWAKKVLESRSRNEINNVSEEIYDAGYDVKRNAKWLEDFYLEKFDTA